MEKDDGKYWISRLEYNIEDSGKGLLKSVHAISDKKSTTLCFLREDKIIHRLFHDSGLYVEKAGTLVFSTQATALQAMKQSIKTLPELKKASPKATK